MVKAFGIDVKEVRRIANSIGIPKDIPLPYVTVRKLKGDRVADIGRLERKDIKEYPAGVAIDIDSKALESITKEGYVLGKEATNHIKHELIHYMQWRKSPMLWRSDREMAIDTHISTELDAELNSKQQGWSPSMIIAHVALNTAEDRGISIEDSLKRTRKIAKKMGVSEGILNRTEWKLRSRGKLPSKKTLTEEVNSSREKTSSRLAEKVVDVKEHHRRGIKGTVRKHKRRQVRRVNG